MILYVANWGLAIIWSIVITYAGKNHPRIGQMFDGGVATFSLLGAATGIGLVVIGLKYDKASILLLLVLAFFASLVAFPCLWVEKKITSSRKD